MCIWYSILYTQRTGRMAQWVRMLTVLVEELVPAPASGSSQPPVILVLGDLMPSAPTGTAYTWYI